MQPSRTKRFAPMTFARLDSFTRGQIHGLRQGEMSREEIRNKVTKKDGKRPTLRTIDNVLGKMRNNPEWRGEDSRAGGRPIS